MLVGLWGQGCRQFEICRPELEVTFVELTWGVLPESVWSAMSAPNCLYGNTPKSLKYALKKKAPAHGDAAVWYACVRKAFGMFCKCQHC